ncbi:MAG: HAMP domain-containing histidine kinase, partial [Gammaproteobacteria bacterium]|nr:HAMP domain-containing histidine kinase [Gammaproteobacteria bacterium]NIR95803.1 HAMP domain-containing histidine kinase [Gammaproteobacteria bacterium]
QREAVEQIIRGGQHLLQLINEVLDIAKVDSGTIDLSMEEVSIGELINDCINLTDPLQKKYEVSIRFEDCGDIRIEADRTRMKQIMVNLLSNAMKYNREKGQVVIRCVAQDD